MALPKMRIRIWLNPKDDGDPREVVADVRHVDRLTAERSLVALGANGLPLTMTTAWAWAALKRAGEYDGPFERFMHVDCLNLEPLDDEDDEIPPTEEPTGSPSPSP